MQAAWSPPPAPNDLVQGVEEVAAVEEASGKPTVEELERKRDEVGLTRDEADTLGRLYAERSGQPYANADDRAAADGAELEHGSEDEALLPGRPGRDLRAEAELGKSAGAGESIEATEDVAAPARRAYERWLRFEDFPTFMDGVEVVERTTPHTLRWVTELEGERTEWAARIVEERPDEAIAWVSTDGIVQEGRVEFRPAGPDRTEIHLRVFFAPASDTPNRDEIMAKVADQVRSNLRRFKERLEASA